MTYRESISYVRFEPLQYMKDQNGKDRDIIEKEIVDKHGRFLKEQQIILDLRWAWSWILMADVLVLSKNGTKRNCTNDNVSDEEQL